MAKNSNIPHVLIIGGGLAGLTLAQALRARNYTFQVFDRDVSEVARNQGWCITLHGEYVFPACEIILYEWRTVDLTIFSQYARQLRSLFPQRHA
jgi:glycine/D-amino acid oxidase-like deaminating enzyme